MSERGRRLVLVVEDNPDVRESLRLLLTCWGFPVEVAENGMEGVRKALELRPVAAILDIRLPDMEGYEVARQIRASLGRDIWLAAYTSCVELEILQQSQAGFDAHLVKPANPVQLEALLKEVCGR